MSGGGLSPSQTVGPFFSIGLLRGDLNVLASGETAGERVRIEGTVYDGDRAPIPDAIVEIWQANAYGRYRHPRDQRPVPLDPSFVGFGRSGTEDAGRFWFDTVKPGPVPYKADRMQAPHINVLVAARGLLDHLSTRLYFADEPRNVADPVLALVPAPRRPTLLAHRADAAGAVVYRFDVVIQGDDETVFFELR